MSIGNIDHKAASGNPPETPAPAQEEWELVEGDVSAGIEQRFTKGKKQYRAVAAIDDPRFPGERGPVYSQEYKACDEADAGRETGWGTLQVAQAQHDRDISAAVARSHMRPDQAAMSDMRRVLKTLSGDLLFPYNQWMQRSARHLEQVQRTALIREQIAMMLSDIEEFGMCDEYETFIAQLQTLLSKKGTRTDGK